MQEERFALRQQKLQAIREQFEETAKAVSLSDSILTENKSENEKLVKVNGELVQTNEQLEELNIQAVARLKSLHDSITPIAQKIGGLKYTISEINSNAAKDAEYLETLDSSSREIQSFVGDVSTSLFEIRDHCDGIVKNIKDYSVLLAAKLVETNTSSTELLEIEKKIETIQSSFEESVRAFAVFEERAIQLERETGYSVKKPNTNI